MLLGTAQAPAAAREAAVARVGGRPVDRPSERLARTPRWREAFRAVRSRTRNPTRGRRHAPKSTSSPTLGAARVRPRAGSLPNRTERCRFRFGRGTAISIEVDQVPAEDDTRSSGAGVELAPALPEARPPYVRELPSQPALVIPTGTVSCEVGVGVPLAFLATATEAVHHRCIHEHGVWRPSAGSRIDAKTGWLRQIHRPDDSWGEESGLQACYREAPQMRGFPVQDV
jgi:hypothetical protein